VIIFSSVLSKKSNQTDLKKTETGSNRPISVRFGFLGQKPIWLDFFGLAWFFRFRFGSVQFFQFQAYKTETKRNRLVFSKF